MKSAAPAAGASPAAVTSAVAPVASASVVSTPVNAGNGPAASPAAPVADAAGVPKPLLATETTAAQSTATPVTDAPPAEILLKAPEGVEMAATDLAAITSFAKDNGLSQKQAEAILARDVAGRKAGEEARQTEVRTIGESWRQEAEKHPEIGGDKLPAAIASAKRALMAHASADERAAISNSPFGNNPIFLAIMARVGARLTEDTVHAGGPSGQTAPAKTPGQIMYPHLYAKG
ncbi:MAG: hypothetical protein V4636_12915 [Pseudomonadota bacterium]